MNHWMMTLTAAGLLFSGLAAWSPGLAGLIGIVSGAMLGTLLVARNPPAYALERVRAVVAPPRAGRRG